MGGTDASPEQPEDATSIQSLMQRTFCGGWQTQVVHGHASGVSEVMAELAMTVKAS